MWAVWVRGEGVGARVRIFELRWGLPYIHWLTDECSATCIRRLINEYSGLHRQCQVYSLFSVLRNIVQLYTSAPRNVPCFFCSGGHVKGCLIAIDPPHDIMGVGSQPYHMKD
jgi:hypothetical protein